MRTWSVHDGNLRTNPTAILRGKTVLGLDRRAPAIPSDRAPGAMSCPHPTSPANGCPQMWLQRRREPRAAFFGAGYGGVDARTARRHPHAHDFDAMLTGYAGKLRIQSRSLAWSERTGHVGAIANVNAAVGPCNGALVLAPRGHRRARASASAGVDVITPPTVIDAKSRASRFLLVG